MMTTRLRSGLSLTASNPLPQKAKMVTAARVRKQKNLKSWSQKTRPKNGPLPRGFCLRLHFWWGRKMATLFALRNHKKNKKKFSAEATRVSLMFDYVVLPSVSLSWHPHGDTGKTTWQIPSSFSYRLLLGHVCEEAHG